MDSVTIAHSAAETLLGHDRNVQVREITQFAAVEVPDWIERHGQPVQYPYDLLLRAGEVGLLELPFLPRSINVPQPMVDYIHTLEEIAFHSFTIAQMIHIQVLASVPLIEFGTSDQKFQWRKELLSGRSIAANCISEFDAGSDVVNIQTTAVRESGNYSISGRKRWATPAAEASVLNVLCKTGEGPQGLTMFFLPADESGWKIGESEEKLAVAALPTNSVVFEAVQAEEKSIVGKRGRGLLVASQIFDRGRLGIAACGLGIANRALSEARGYTKQRRQFGQPVFDFQAIGFSFSELSIRVSAAQALLTEVASRFDSSLRGAELTVLAAKAKICAVDAAIDCVSKSLRMVGGIGYTLDQPYARLLQEALLLQFIEGTREALLQTVKNSL